MKQRNTSGRRKTLSAKGIVIPAVIVIMLMHLLLVLNTVRLNRVGQIISEATQTNFMISGISNGFSATTDQQSELARSYAISGEEALIARYTECVSEAMGAAGSLSDILMKNGFEGADEQLQEALSVYYARREMEHAAIKLQALSRGVDLSAYPSLEATELTEAQLQLPDEAKQGAAVEMMMSSEYQSARGGVQRGLSKAVGMVSDESSAFIRKMSAQMGQYRIMQYVMMAVVIFTLLSMCVLLFTNLLNPLEKCLEIVQRGDAVPDDHGFSELRRLATCYDDLLSHRNQLEADLRHQSLTDALTGLPNRLAFQNALQELETSDYHSLTVFSLDVNGLKAANDRWGHGRGDMLLCDAADCIQKTFAGREGMRCFRFGGDEFAALWVDCDDADVPGVLEAFKADQEARGISVSVGWAHTDTNVGSGVNALFEQADKAMYREKTRLHARRAGDARFRAEDA